MQPPLGSGWIERKTRLLAGSLAIAQQVAGSGEARMKAGAPWTDRTGHARQGLRGETEVVRTPVFVRIRVVFHHSVEYGKWLETVMGAAMGSRAAMGEEELARPEYAGPYAIIHPTAQAMYPDYRNAILRLWTSRGGA